MSGQKDGKHQASYSMGKTKKHEEKREQKNLPQRVEAKCNGALGVKNPYCSITRLAKRREGLGEQHLADFAILPHAVGGSFRA